MIKLDPLGGKIFTLLLLALAAMAKAQEFSSPAAAAPIPPDTKDLPQ